MESVHPIWEVKRQAQAYGDLLTQKCWEIVENLSDSYALTIAGVTLLLTNLWPWAYEKILKKSK